MPRELSTFNPNRTKKIAGIQHVVYEYANLMSAAHYSCVTDPRWVHCNDAFLLGCRKLGDFLLKKKRRKDDVLALDYLPKNSTMTWKLPIWTGQWRDPMNKQLAHVAYNREKKWDHRIWVPQLREEFRKAWRDFQNAITDEEYRKKFDTLLLKRESELRERGIDLGPQ